MGRRCPANSPTWRWEAAVAVAVTGDRASTDDRLAVDCGSSGAARRPGMEPIASSSRWWRTATQPLPIARSASGGKLSQVILALGWCWPSRQADRSRKWCSTRSIPGVGGAAAVGDRSPAVAAGQGASGDRGDAPPRVAAFADNHLVIGKTGSFCRSR